MKRGGLLIKGSGIPLWPEAAEIRMGFRDELHPMFKTLGDGVSEFTFANIYLFRLTHNYRVTRLPGGPVMITGRNGEEDFFMLPFALPEKGDLDRLLEGFSFMKNATEAQARILKSLGYGVDEDRDNFDYLYSRGELSELSGRKFHRKKNLVNAFIGRYNYKARPLTDELVNDARLVLDTLPKMHAAFALYRALGFTEIAPYLAEPTPGARCFTLKL